MISVCCCVINGRYDVEFMVEFLERHNDPSEFEVCLAHDDRVDDRSSEYFAALQAKYPNLKIIKNTKQDTVDYLEKVIRFYQTENLYDTGFMDGLKANLELFKQDKLFDPSLGFLWLSSGMLYNKACSIATGEVLVITPGDFVHMFKMKDLETFVKKHARNGCFYSKPNAIWARVSNQNEAWLRQHTDDVYSGRIINREDFRWDSNQLFRDYAACPSKLSDYWLADFKHNQLINMESPGDFERFYDYNRYAHSRGSGVQASEGFHGFHIMTRTSYQEIGGFTEVYYSRAFPDDRMTDFGRRHFNHMGMPAEFSVGWVGMHECLDGVGASREPGWMDRFKEKEPFWDKHPIAGIRYNHTHLHKGLTIKGRAGEDISHPNHVHTEIVSKLMRYQKPIRFV